MIPRFAAITTVLILASCATVDIGVTDKTPFEDEEDFDYTECPICPEGYSVSRPWRKKLLTYKVEQQFRSRTHQILRKLASSSFSRWDKVCGLSFREVGANEPADITVAFHRNQHGDGHGFDGPGGVLAHAFFPEDGRIHMDIDERWVISANRARRDFYSVHCESVLTHEIGHSIGIGHTNMDGNLMEPRYDGPEGLGIDDIRAARRLYGR